MRAVPVLYAYRARIAAGLIDEVLTEASAAHVRMQAGEHAGKIVLAVKN